MSEIVKFTPRGAGFVAGRKSFKAAAPKTKSGTDLLKLRKTDGAWVFGQKNVPLGAGTKVAINAHSMAQGWVAWKGGKPVGEKMAVVGQEPVNPSTLGEVDAPKGWEEQIAMGMQVVDGEHANTPLNFKANSKGGIDFYNEVFDAMEARAAEGYPFHPIITLGSDSYVHSEHGKIYFPTWECVGWMDDDGNTDGAKREQVETYPEQDPAAAEPEVEDTIPEAEPVDEPPRRRRRRTAAG